MRIYALSHRQLYLYNKPSFLNPTFQQITYTTAALLKEIDTTVHITFFDNIEKAQQYVQNNKSPNNLPTTQLLHVIYEVDLPQITSLEMIRDFYRVPYDYYQMVLPRNEFVFLKAIHEQKEYDLHGWCPQNKSCFLL